MPQFRIETTGANSGKAEFEKVLRDLSALEQSAGRVRRSLSFRIRQRNQIDNDLKRIEAKLQAHQRDCRMIADCLGQASDRYMMSERRITGEFHEKSTPNIWFDISTIVDGLRAVLYSELLTGVVGDVSASWTDWWFERDTSGLFDKISGSVRHGEIGAKGSFFGIPFGAKMTGDLLGFEAGKKLYAEWNPEEGEVSAEISGEIEGYLAKGKYEEDFGLLHSEMSAAVGVAGVSGAAGFRFMKDGEIDPELYVKGKAELKGITGDISAKVGDDNHSAEVGAEGAIGELSAEGEASVSKDGVVLKGELMAAAATGSVKGEVKSSLFGNLKVEARGSLGSAGVAGECNISKKEITLGVDAAAGAGAGVTVTYEPPAWVGDAVDAAWDGVTTVADAAWDGITNAADAAWEGASNFAENTWDGITAGANAVGDWFDSWW